MSGRFWTPYVSWRKPQLHSYICLTQQRVARTAEAYECSSEITWFDRIPAVYNTPEMTELALRAAGTGEYPVKDAVPSLASEDYALYRAFVPSFLYWVGSRMPGEKTEDLHKPLFHTDDEALRCASWLYAASVLNLPVKELS